MLRRIVGAGLLIVITVVVLALAGQYAFEVWVALQEPVVDPGRAPAPSFPPAPGPTPQPIRPTDATPEGLSGQLSTSTWPPVPISPQTADRVQQLSVLGGYDEFVVSLAFSPDGRLLAAGGKGMARVLQLPEGKEIFAFKDKGYGPVQMAFSPTGHLAAFGTRHSVTLYDARSWKQERVIDNLDGSPFSLGFLQFGPDGSYLAAASDAGNAVTLADVETGREMLRIQVHSPTGQRPSGERPPVVFDLAISSQGDLLATVSNEVKLWSLPDGRLVRTLSNRTLTNPLDNGTSVQFSPDGKLVALGSIGVVKLWDAASGREVRALTGHKAFITSISFSPDGRLLASGSGDRSVRLYDVQTGRELRVFVHGHEVLDAVISPDGMFLASGTWERIVRLWGVK